VALEEDDEGDFEENEGGRTEREPNYENENNFFIQVA
jgi:hypothetical protein